MPDNYDESVLEELEALQDALEAGQYSEPSADLTEAAALRVVDLYADYEPLFNDEAKAAMQNKMNVQSRFVRNDEGMLEPEMTRYFALKVKGEDKIEEAVNILAAVINMYARAGFISGFLCQLSKLQLLAVGADNLYCVFTFPMFTDKGLKFLNEHPSPLEVEEGGMPTVEIS